MWKAGTGQEREVRRWRARRVAIVTVSSTRTRVLCVSQQTLHDLRPELRDDVVETRASKGGWHAPEGLYNACCTIRTTWTLFVSLLHPSLAFRVARSITTASSPLYASQRLRRSPAAPQPQTSRLKLSCQHHTKHAPSCSATHPLDE